MKSLCGSSFVVPMKLVTLPASINSSVEPSLAPRRPGHRLCHSLPDGSMLAIEMPDLCHMTTPVSSAASQVEFNTCPTFSIEIKPKWGFLPFSETTIEPSDPRNTVCRFCLHQFLKISLGSWSYHSSYCPIDLFSGCVYRMKFALNKLLESPQNNLRLFKDGELFWGDSVKSDLNLKLAGLFETTVQDGSSQLASFVDLVVQCLLHEETQSSLDAPVAKRQTCAESAASKEHSCTSDCNRLPTNCILSRLLGVQQLSTISLEDLFTLYSKLQDHFKECDNERERSQIDGPFSADWLCVPLMKGDLSLQSALFKVKEFLISRSAKDCSIFITMKQIANPPSEVTPPPSPQRHFTVTSRAGQHFVCCATAVDLDPKRFDKIPFYRDEDESIVNNYSNNVLPLKFKNSTLSNKT